jgi:Protein of unknown function (DUF4232)
MNPFPGTARRAIAAMALACVAALVAACSHPSGSPASSAGTPTPSSASTTLGPATPVPVSSASAPSGPGPCPTQSLKVKPGASQGTAGSVYTAIDFTNISHVTCTLYGYPGVSLTSTVPGAPIGKPAVENPATPRQLVTLQPDVTANALLRIVDAGNFPPSRCGPVTAHYLKIYPPNQTSPVYVHYRVEACTKPVHLLTVDVVKPGSGSS